VAVRAVGDGVDHLVRTYLHLETHVLPAHGEGQPRHAVGELRVEQELTVIITHATETGDHRQPGAGRARRCADRRGCCSPGCEDPSARPRAGSRAPAPAGRPLRPRWPGCTRTVTSPGQSTLRISKRRGLSPLGRNGCRTSAVTVRNKWRLLIELNGVDCSNYLA